MEIAKIRYKLYILYNTYYRLCPRTSFTAVLKWLESIFLVTLDDYKKA